MSEGDEPSDAIDRTPDSTAADDPFANQPTPLADSNPFASHLPFVEALRREGGASAEARVAGFGEICGRAETIALGFAANANPPVLRPLDRAGRRLDAVEFHPSWHALLGLGVEHALAALPWREPGPGAHVARAALFVTLAEVEAGVGCPLSMTYSAVPALRVEPAVAAEWEPRLGSLVYDPRPLPAGEKRGALCGMAMTERQGGSDVRANTTRATPLPGGDDYQITGHKWFCSAPMCDAFLILAQAPGGLTCFLLPRLRADGGRNGFAIDRLKDKLGNRSNASSEITLDGAVAHRIGPEGRGVPTILEMVFHTRLDCALGATAALRVGTAQALWHARHRRAFGRLLIDQPLMRNVLADLALESEAATALAFRLARSFDRAPEDETEAAFRRLATPVAKYWLTKRAAPHAAEALECLGGNGYVEEWGLARLYREAPLNSIWEGSGNVQCLDVLRAAKKSPDSVAALFAEIAEARGADARLDLAARELKRDVKAALEGADADVELRARHLTERLALVLQASLLIRHVPAAVADAFTASRIAGDWGRAFGTLPVGVEFGVILERHEVRR